MSEISDRYRRLSQAFADTVAAVPDDRWENPSPCEDWTARDVVRHVVQTPGIFWGMIGREYPEPPSVDVHRHVGRYERASVMAEVLLRDGQGVLRQTVTGPLAELLPDPTHEFVMVPVDETGDLFVVREPESLTWIPVTFYSLPTGEKYLHVGVRATPKVG